MREIERLWDAPAGSPDDDRLQVLVLLVEAYEREHHPIDPPEPVDALRFRMEQEGIVTSDPVKPVAQFTAGLDAFARQFRAQLSNAGAPGSEHAIHFCLALGFQAAYDLAPGNVVFERPTGSGRIDLWFIPFDLIVEVKFRRPIPSGRNLPATQLFGSLLADFNKVARFRAERRLVLYVTDQFGARYLERSGRGLLPLAGGPSIRVEPEQVAALPATAARHAVADGPWTALTARLAWSDTLDGWSMFAWDVTVDGAGSPEHA